MGHSRHRQLSEVCSTETTSSVEDGRAEVTARTTDIDLETERTKEIDDRGHHSPRPDIG